MSPKPFALGEDVHFCPGAVGGAEWNSPAYDPQTNLILVGEVDWCDTVTPKNVDELRTVKVGQPWAGMATCNPFDMFGQHGRTTDTGRDGFTPSTPTPASGSGALKSNYPIVGGMTPTAGGVVFFGDIGGNFYALDSATGQKLWGQDLGGAIGGGVITYTADGAQKVAVAAGFTIIAWPTKTVTRQGRRPRASTAPTASERGDPRGAHWSCMELDPVFLSRIQFAFVISFHIIFPAFTIGLAAWLATIEGVRLVTGNPLYRRVFDFWLKVFAVSFGMGVVTGIVMAFQFGTNWGVLAERTGLDPGAAARLRGVHRLHARGDILRRHAARARPRVAAASISSPAAWSRSAPCSRRSGSSPTTAGCRCRSATRSSTARSSRRTGARSCSGRCMMVRWPHMLLAAFLTTGMCVAATGAWYLLRGIHRAEARVMLHWGLGLVAVLIPVQLFFGHLTGLYVLKHQPAKFAAIEARWKTPAAGQRGADRLARRGERAQSLRDRDPEARQLHRLGQLDRARDRAGDVPDRGPAAGADPVLRLPHHGRHGADHAGGLLVRKLPALARPAGDDALVPVGHVPVVPDRLRRHPHRLVHRRGRPPALGRLRPAAHQGRGDAVADDRRRAVLAHRLRARLRDLRRLRHSTTSTSCCAKGRPARPRRSRTRPPSRPLAFADTAASATGSQPGAEGDGDGAEHARPVLGRRDRRRDPGLRASSTASISASASCSAPRATRPSAGR